VVPTVQRSNTATNLPNGAKSTRKWRYRIDNMSLDAFRYISLCQRGISTGKLIIWTIDCWKYCAKNHWKTKRIVRRRPKHPTRGANSLSDVAVIVTINAEFDISLIWGQEIPSLNSFQQISFPSIVTVYSLARSTLHLPFVSNPSLVAQTGVSLACHCICMQRKLFQHSERRTSWSDYDIPKPSPWYDSSCTKWWRSYYLSDSSTV